MPYFFAKNTPLERPWIGHQFMERLQEAPESHIQGKVELGRAIFASMFC
ncbi:MAG: hypothetical protein QM752_06855 [Gammaproteobacteria bacterium]